MASSSSSPTTRSRTLLFISYRDSRAGSSRARRSRVVTTYDDALDDNDEHERLINADPGHISIDAELPPKCRPCSAPVRRVPVADPRRMSRSTHSSWLGLCGQNNHPSLPCFVARDAAVPAQSAFAVRIRP
ncbi:hypothetical protein C8Q78DRAFT_520842 [Trametes maxima]|nr:hypothetical protein C8Q78DRAFT_520842 [Trametes maxima]